MSDEHDAPPWDEQQASRLVEATVLIGLTWLNGAGNPEYEQMFGVITTADARRGVEIALKGTRTGETYWLPPDTRNFQEAPPGEYRLKSTGEVVIGPGFHVDMDDQPSIELMSATSLKLTVPPSLWLLSEVGALAASWLGPTSGGSRFFAVWLSPFQAALDLTALRSLGDIAPPCDGSRKDC